jgi:hypothetical protein
MVGPCYAAMTGAPLSIAVDVTDARSVGATTPELARRWLHDG